MTIIAAVIDGNSAYIAADWACSYDDTDVLFIDNSPKVREFPIEGSNTPALIGMAGDSAIPSLLHGLILPPLPKDGPDIIWADSVARAVTKRIMESPLPPMLTYEDGQQGINGDFLMVIGHKIYRLLDNAAMEPAAAFDAIGTGGDFTLGYIAGRLEDCISPSMKDVLADAVEAACMSVSSCDLGGRPPFLQLAKNVVGKGAFARRFV
ncbi:hypothetical protein HOT75_gp062 [Gordonia phage Daredevil]|uniref:Uncharacterized protein n=1 Tax=Gordonia phage Daredevil TaxID=2283286 RepID=A0A345MIR8_9CAUD|nr:hypothetical protein HOT75_gp062 [Gordonia phage Daredevil]AXH70449.1 hypothetical protein SEA_DAREDEVIL_62 [Gordonia phage Daredevil]